MPGGLLLFDGNACATRATYAVSPRLGAKGRFRSFQHSLLALVLRTLRKESPGYVAVLWEEPPPALRGTAPSELFQILGIPTFQRHGYSVGQLALSLIDQARRQGLLTTLVTTRRSLLQLVGEKVRLVNPAREMLHLDAERIFSLFGVLPQQIPDYLALVGYPAEGIPGVKGIGPRSAARLLKRFGSLQKILESLGELPLKIRENLSVSLDRIRLGQATLKVTPRASDLSLEICRPRSPDLVQVLSRFAQEGMTDLLPEILPHAHPEKVSYLTVLSPDQLDSLVTQLMNADCFSLDTETTGLDLEKARLVGISFAVGVGLAFYIPISHRYPGCPEQPSLDQVAQRLKPILEDPSKLKIGQNLKFDLHVLKKVGLSLQGPVFDTMIVSSLLYPDLRSHSLDSLSLSLLGIKMIPIGELIGEGKTMGEVEISKATEYACEDADCAIRLYQLLAPGLEASGFHSLFTQVEMPLLVFLAEMEDLGLPIDRERAEELHTLAGQRSRELAEEIFSLAGERFDPESPRQLRRILQEKLGTKFTYRTRAGRLSLRRSDLARWSDRHPLLQRLLQYQDWVRFLRERLAIIPEHLDPASQRFKVSFHQAATATGGLKLPRFFQGWGEEWTDRLKSLVKAPEGKVLLEACFRHLFQRVLAHWSRDPELLKSIKEGGAIPEPGEIQKLPQVQQALRRILVQAKRQGQVTTLLKRVRRLPQLNSPHSSLRKAAEEEALETILRGSLADILKLAIVRVGQCLKEKAFRTVPVLVFPEGILLEVPQEELPWVAPLVKEEMEKSFTLSVPLEVQISVGSRFNCLSPYR